MNYSNLNELFSTSTPVLQAFRKWHTIVFETGDAIARSQLDFAGKVLDANRARFEKLSENTSPFDLADSTSAFGRETGELAIAQGEQLADILKSGYEDLAQAANDATAKSAATAKSKPAAKNAKAA